jgi:hypothetical protein
MEPRFEGQAALGTVRGPGHHGPASGADRAAAVNRVSAPAAGPTGPA